MAVKPLTSSESSSGHRLIRQEDFQVLARHARELGQALALLNPDGSLALQDPCAAPFFRDYLFPALAATLRSAQAALPAPADSDPADPVLLRSVPGAVVAALPCIERRQPLGTLLLAARGEDFSLSEDVRRTCDALALDAQYVANEAQRLPSCDPAILVRSARLLLALLRQQLRADALERDRSSLSIQLANAYEELALIDQISSGMRINRPSSDFFRQVCLDVMPVIGVRGMGVVVHSDKHQQEPVLVGQLALPMPHLRRLANQLMDSLHRRQRILLNNNLRGDAYFYWLGDAASRVIAVPMLRADKLLGCLFGLDKLSGDFDSTDAKLLTAIANECAVYLENAILYDDVHGLMMGLLHSLTSAVDAKDAYTCGHSERVASFSRFLAGQAGLAEADIEQIYMAGLLHDVGKIGIPEAVLQKNGRLTPEEFELMKRHCQIGAKILGDVRQLENLVPGVLHHHERYDGRGYPMGLAGRDIPIMGRIICLADCFDAMTSNRTYRKALPLELALSEIRRCSGTQFDPVLAELLLRVPRDQFHMLLRTPGQQSCRLPDSREVLAA